MPILIITEKTSQARDLRAAKLRPNRSASEYLILIRFGLLLLRGQV